jgi:hypothetical protein
MGMGLVGFRTIAIAANPGASLEQCRNGEADDPNDCEELGSGTGWVSGNAGASTAHLREGYSIPYRAIMTNVPTSGGDEDVTLTLGYDIKHSGAHAIDFLTHYDRYEPHAQFGHPAEDVEPTSGFDVSGLDMATCAIPKPGNLSSGAGEDAGDTFDALPAGEKLFTIWGADSCTVTQGDLGNLADAQSQATVEVDFHATNATVIAAWGGHIALGGDWEGLSASTISGSPYHMRLLDWTLSNLGNQDRSLAAAAVVQVETSVTTTIHDGSHTAVLSVSVGTTVHDSATVVGGGGGTVHFNWFTNGTCEGTPVDVSGEFALVGGTADGTTFTKTPTTAGSYAFQGVYSGDENFLGATSACEPLTVTKINPSVATTIHDASHNPVLSVDVGTTVHDSATVTGSLGTPTGTVIISWFTNGTCTGTADSSSTATALVGGTVDVTGFTKTPNTSGSFAFQAFYGGNDTYNSLTGPCEPLTVNKVTPSLSTTPAVQTRDSVTVTGFGTPAGTVDFKLYKDDNTCQAANLVFQDLDNALSSGSATSDWFSIAADGTYYWQVSYTSTDATNADAVSTCAEATVFDLP